MSKDRPGRAWVWVTFASAVALSSLLATWLLAWSVERGPARVVHGLAGLSAILAGVGYSLSRRRCSAPSLPIDLPSPPLPSGAAGESPAQARCGQGGSGADAHSDPATRFRSAAAIAGLLAFLLMVFQAVFETVARTTSFSFGSTPRAQLWATGRLDLCAICVSVILLWLATRDRQMVTVLFWILIFAGLWEALLIPPYERREAGGYVHEVATAWSSLFLIGSAGLVVIFTAAGGMLESRRRARAWPGELWKLAEPLPAWPGFRYSAGVVGVLVLILGCVHLARPMTPAAALAAGAAMLALAHRRWEENLADVGLGLLTLGVASLVALWRPTPRSESDFFVEVFNRVLVGLALMTAFWHWLSGVWLQQLDGGRAWTTAGRLLRPARRVGFLAGAAGLLVSMHLAIWPLLPYSAPVHSAWQWSWGMGGNILLIAALAYSALQTGKTTLAWLAVMACASSAAYVMSRNTGSAPMNVWGRLWPMIMPLLAGALLLLAAAVHRSRRWAPFWEPLYLSGLLILPMAAITGVSLVEQWPLPGWVPAATFAGLTGVYGLAAWRPGPRGFLIVAGICAAVAIYMTV
ncbi:MAG: hypothetical protein HRF43_10800 [Phycisphaerae bacterium]|jgi:hypothetical protein